jgi:hypothetical protein
MSAGLPVIADEVEVVPPDIEPRKKDRRIEPDYRARGFSIGIDRLVFRGFGK